MPPIRFSRYSAWRYGAGQTLSTKPAETAEHQEIVAQAIKRPNKVRVTLGNVSDITTQQVSRSGTDFREHKMRLVQIDNFLKPSLAEAIAMFLSTQARFEETYGVHNQRRPTLDRESWLARNDEDRLFHFEVLSGIVGNQLGKNALAYVKLRQFLSSEGFCSFVKEIVGLDLVGATEARLHRLREEHFLRPHHDRQKTRRIAYILYLSPDWHADHGGQLCLIGKDGAKVSIVPQFNRLVLFDIDHHDEHYIDAFTSQASNQTRDTMNGWLLGA